MVEQSFISALLIILGASLGGTILFRRLRLPAIIAYIVVGALVGPNLLDWIQDPGAFSLAAEFGVAFLLFSIGLEFSLSKMLELRFAVFGLGSIQVTLCAIIFALAVYLWGATLPAAIIIAGALALSSTAIVTRELSDQQQFDSPYAQLSLGVLLFQDLIAVLFLIIVPVLGSETSDSFALLLLTSIAKGLLFFLALMAVGKWVLPYVYHEVARGKSEETFVLSTLFIALLATWLTHAFGLSMALGGFVIGMMLSESSFKHQIMTDIRPFKDILLGLFFVTVGMSIELSLLQSHWFRILVFTVALITTKALVVAAIVRVFGSHGSKTPFRAGISLAHAGEFGLALITLAYASGIIPLDQSSFIIIIIILSMIVSPILIRHSNSIAGQMLAYLPGAPPKTEPDPSPIKLHHSNHVVIGGFGRVGQTIAQLMESNNIPYIGIDENIDLVTETRKSGSNVVFGDCTNMEILQSCHIGNARLAVLTFRSVDLARSTIMQIRTKNIQVPIIVRCHSHENFEELISIGANHVIPEMLEASLMIGSQALSILNVEPGVIEQQLEDIRNRNLVS